jgi:hypothetical protein
MLSSYAVSNRAGASRACLVALATRLLLPAAYLGGVGFYPVFRFDFGVGAAIVWLLLSVIVVPTAAVVLLLILSGRGRSRARRHVPR